MVPSVVPGMVAPVWCHRRGARHGDTGVVAPVWCHRREESAPSAARVPAPAPEDDGVVSGGRRGAGRKATSPAGTRRAGGCPPSRVPSPAPRTPRRDGAGVPPPASEAASPPYELGGWRWEPSAASAPGRGFRGSRRGAASRGAPRGAGLLPHARSRGVSRDSAPRWLEKRGESGHGCWRALRPGLGVNTLRPPREKQPRAGGKRRRVGIRDGGGQAGRNRAWSRGETRQPG